MGGRLTKAQWELLGLLDTGDREGISDPRTVRVLERKGLAVAGDYEGAYSITASGRRALAEKERTP